MPGNSSGNEILRPRRFFAPVALSNRPFDHFLPARRGSGIHADVTESGGYKMSDQRLPEFADPPVVEVAISLEFSPLDWWGIPHFGMFWQTIRDDFPKQLSAPPVPSTIENFEKPAPPPSDGVSFTFNPDPNGVRCSFMSDSGTDAIQVQRDRFIRNWQRTSADAQYPRYLGHIRPEFERSLSKFSEFVNSNAGDAASKVILPRQIEMTYVNEFVKGREWDNYPDLGSILTVWGSSSKTSFLPRPYGVRAGVSYDMPDHRGRLHVVVQRATKASGDEEILQMRLTARSRVGSAELESVLESADLSHEWIVRGFAELTTEKMHQIWGEV
jgi:uncharacterized protein (TIGR04255 family)